MEDVLEAVRRNRDSNNRVLEESAYASLLYAIAVVTYPHEMFTRYPDGEIKPADYVKGLGIVDAQGEVVAVLRRCMDRVEQNYLLP